MQGQEEGMLNTIPTESEEAARTSKNRLENENQAAFRPRGEQGSAHKLFSTRHCSEWATAINVGSCNSDLSCTHASRRNLSPFFLLYLLSDSYQKKNHCKTLCKYYK